MMSASVKKTKLLSELTQKEFDTKLQKAIKKLHESYAAELAKKKCITVIDFKDRPQIIETSKKNPEPKIKKATKKSASPCKTCCATKMDGNKCTAKVKKGCDFCGRHGPKSKK